MTANLQTTSRERDRLQNEITTQRFRFAPQRTLDNTVIPSISKMSQVYAALGLSIKNDGSRIDQRLLNTSFTKPPSELTDRRLRQAMQLVRPPLELILSAAFPNDAHEFLQIMAATMGMERRESSVRTRLIRESMADLPIVKDVVAAINYTSDRAEKVRLLSVLTSSFSMQNLNSDALGLGEAVSRRLLYMRQDRMQKLLVLVSMHQILPSASSAFAPVTLRVSCEIFAVWITCRCDSCPWCFYDDGSMICDILIHFSYYLGRSIRPQRHPLVHWRIIEGPCCSPDQSAIKNLARVQGFEHGS